MTVAARSLFFRRAALCLLGNFVLAFGVAMAVKADLGITPVNSIAFVLSKVLSVDHGLMTGIIYACYVLIQLAILRREFRLNNLLQAGAALMFGWFVFLCNHILAFQVPDFYQTPWRTDRRSFQASYSSRVTVAFFALFSFPFSRYHYVND